MYDHRQLQASEAARDAETVTELLRARTEAAPHALAYRFITGAQQAETLTRSELWLRSCQLADALRCRDLVGRRVIVSPTSNLHFVLTFFGCLLAGAIAVPAPPTTSRRRSERVRLLAEDAGASVLVGDADRVLDAARAAGIAVVDSRELLARPAAPGLDERLPVQSGDSLAFLQYTSGSTSQPKGVMISHRNVLANCKAIQIAMRMDQFSRKLCPLPLFHDMALVGSILEPLYAGFESTLVPPALFVQQPLLWLRLISELGITHTGGPNFMFELAAAAMAEQEVEGLDLSGWRCAYSGAEPIRHRTIMRFVAGAERYGFDRAAFYPCYGLAESTLFVSGAEAGKWPRFADDLGHHPVVSCGLPGTGIHLAVVDPLTCRARAEGNEGEIWVRGASVSAGYWNRPELSRQVFHTRLEGATETFLRTGDLGVLRDGELYVTGRLKDVIIVRGRKYAPQDIELAAESGHPAAQTAAAVAVESDDETLLIITVEISRRAWHDKPAHEEIRRSVRRAVAEAIDLAPVEVILTTPQAIPRTTSGKLKRSALELEYRQRASLRQPQADVAT